MSTLNVSLNTSFQMDPPDLGSGPSINTSRPTTSASNVSNQAIQTVGLTPVALQVGEVTGNGAVGIRNLDSAAIVTLTGSNVSVPPGATAWLPSVALATQQIESDTAATEVQVTVYQLS